MGKDLKGRQLGTGISQRKDGLYSARYTDGTGRRRQKNFKKARDAQAWLNDMQYAKRHGMATAPDMTVDAWFEYWLYSVKAGVRWTTKKAYLQRYKMAIGPAIGSMLLKDVRPLHLQMLLDGMEGHYSRGTAEGIRKTLAAFFGDAVENGILPSSPVKKSVKVTVKGEPRENVLTREGQAAFLDAAKGSAYYLHFAFILQTGLRASELRGLKWEDVDADARVLHVRRGLTYAGRGEYTENPTKTESGRRDIPLTDEALRILERAKSSRRIVNMEYADNVFVNLHGRPGDSGAYSRAMARICEKADVPPVTMHGLRHTFATRCIESGMSPKTLQAIMGHSGIGITMDTYVHSTVEQRAAEMKIFARNAI